MLLTARNDRSVDLIHG